MANELQEHLPAHSSLRVPCSQAQVSSLESQLAEAQADREQLRARLDRTTADLDAQLAASGQQRQQLAAAQQAERELHAAFKTAEASSAQSSRQVRTAPSQRAGWPGLRLLPCSAPPWFCYIAWQFSGPRPECVL